MVWPCGGGVCGVCVCLSVYMCVCDTVGAYPRRRRALPCCVCVFCYSVINSLRKNSCLFGSHFEFKRVTLQYYYQV